MLRKLLILGICAGSSASVPILYQSNPDAFLRLLRPAIDEPTAAPELPAAGIMAIEPIAPATEVLLGRKVRISADARGHFNADFKFNGRSIGAMVDTGATLVAINMSTARRIGIQLTPADFKYEVKTANGKTGAASATIERLQIGRIIVENVDAVVLDDKALDGTLIGVSFLKRLTKYQVENGALLLMQ